MPGRTRKITFVGGTGQFPQRFAKWAAELYEVAEPDPDDDIFYDTTPTKKGKRQNGHLQLREGPREMELAPYR